MDGTEPRGANVTPSDLCLFADAPHEHDPRQDCFRVVIGGLEDEADPGTLEKISMRGFRASCVDLGWLSDRCAAWWEAEPERPPSDAEELTALISKELPEVVQRLKHWKIEVDDEDGALRVLFQTKDDYNYYHYGFDVCLGSDDPPGEEEDLPEDEEEAA